MRAVLPYGVTTGSAAAAPTPEIWHLCPIEAIDAGRIRGWHFWDDFISFPTLSASTTASQTYHWTSYGDTGGTAAQIADEVGGVLQLNADTADESVAITTGGNTGGFLKLDASHRVWFEARFKVSSIANTTSGWFVGLTQETMAAVDAVIAADGTFADVDYVGFSAPEADGNVCEPVFNKTSGTDVIMEADAKTLVADTYIKAGMLWDPTGRPDEFLRIFFDGTEDEQSAYDTKGTKANTISDTTNFPGGEELAVTVFGEAAATARTLELDWIKAAAMPIT
jgi:hypothetical protein